MARADLDDGVTDEALVARFVDPAHSRGAREQAFHTLARRYQRRLFAICVRVLRDPQDAEEAVQETLVRLARHADRFRGDAKLSTWLYRVARNVCTDRVRFEARRPATPVADIREVADQPDAQDAIDGYAEASAVGAALHQLDERSRQVLLLVAVDGLTYAEAAEITGDAVGTVKSRVSRARVRLGELLAETPDEPIPSAAPPAEPRSSTVSGATEARGPPSQPDPDG